MTAISVAGCQVGDWLKVPAVYFTDHPSAQGSFVDGLITHFEVIDRDEYAIVWSPLFTYTVPIWSSRNAE
jgi:hypothetical protein